MLVYDNSKKNCPAFVVVCGMLVLMGALSGILFITVTQKTF